MPWFPLGLEPGQSGFYADGSTESLILVWVFAGLAAITLGYFVLRRLTAGMPSSRGRIAADVLLAAAVVAPVALAALGHLPWPAAAGAALLPIAAILVEVWLPRLPWLRRRQRGRTSQLRTKFLRVTLRHDSGAFDGKVLRGAYRGRLLSSMTGAELRLLIVEAASDPESVNILTTYIDGGPSGEEAGHAAGNGANGAHRGGRGKPGDGGMERDEAYRVLGLAPGASREAVRQAYRSIMKQVHPDQGGSDYLASKVNEAKELLLGA